MKKSSVRDCPQPETRWGEVHYGPPDWSRKAQGFKHLDGTNADWRSLRPVRHADRTNRHAMLRYLGIAGWVVLTIILGIMALAKGGWLP